MTPFIPTYYMNSDNWPENGRCRWTFEQNPSIGFWMAYYSPQGPEMNRLYRWIEDQFGPADGERWHCNNGWIGFRDERDKNWFLLRWSSA